MGGEPAYGNSLATAQITLSSVKLCLSLHEAEWNETLLQSLVYFMLLQIVLLKISSHGVYAF